MTHNDLDEIHQRDVYLFISMIKTYQLLVLYEIGINMIIGISVREIISRLASEMGSFQG